MDFHSSFARSGRYSMYVAATSASFPAGPPLAAEPFRKPKSSSASQARPGRAQARARMGDFRYSFVRGRPAALPARTGTDSGGPTRVGRCGCGATARKAILCRTLGSHDRRLGSCSARASAGCRSPAASVPAGRTGQPCCHSHCGSYRDVAAARACVGKLACLWRCFGPHHVDSA